MSEVIDRLINSSAGLQRAISATGADFAAAEHSLSERMDYFRSICTNVAGEINQLNQSTRAALDEASSLAETIARHKDGLESSAGDLSRQQRDLDQLLTARHDPLDRLSTASRCAAKTWKA